MEEFFAECLVFVTGMLGIASNTVDITQPGTSEEQIAARVEQGWEAFNNIQELERSEDNNDDIGSIFGSLFNSGGGRDGDDSDFGYDYKPGSSVEESSSGWSIFGYSGVDGDYTVDTSTDGGDSDYSSDSSGESDSDGDRGSWW